MSISQNERERAIYRSRRKFQTDMQSNLATAEDNGRTKAMVASIRNLMDSTGWSMEQAMSVLKVPDEERVKYRELLNS